VIYKHLCEILGISIRDFKVAGITPRIATTNEGRMNRKSLSRFAFIGTAIILAVTISTRTASASSSKGANPYSVI
jgi:hypothetical protein